MNPALDLFRHSVFSQLDWVIFDADNTLWDLEALYHNARDRLCRLLASYGYDPADVEQYQRQRDIELFQEYGRAPNRFPQSLVDTLLHFNVAPRAEEVEAVWNIGMQVFDTAAQPYKEIAKGLQELSKHARIAIFTAGAKDLQRKRIAEFPYRELASACEIVETKDTDAFHLLLNSHGMHPYYSWMIGDSLRSDIIPARSVGLNTIWVRSDNWTAVETAGISELQFTDRDYIVDTVSDAINIVLQGFWAVRGKNLDLTAFTRQPKTVQFRRDAGRKR